MDDVNDLLEVRAQLQALEMTLSLLLAGAAMGNPKMLGNMHQALQGMTVDAVRNVGADQPELPAGYGDRLEALIGQNLDRIFSTARAIK